MTNIVLVLGAFFVLAGAFAVVLPRVFREAVAKCRAPAALRFALLMRVTIGVILLLAAPYCRFTIFLQVLGAVVVLAGVTLALIGRERSDRLFAWWDALSDHAVRGIMILPVVIGAVLILAAI